MVPARGPKGRAPGIIAKASYLQALEANDYIMCLLLKSNSIMLLARDPKGRALGNIITRSISLRSKCI